MKKHWLFTTLLAIALCVICFTLFPTEAEADSVSNLTFTLNSNGKSYTVSNCARSVSGTLTIPATYNGKPVTSIGDKAFYGCDSLTSIFIPDSVTSIGDEAFYGCDSLTSIFIPDSVTSIGDYVFFNCSNLTSVTIPDGVTSIGNYAFSGCSSLTEITIPDSVTSIGVSAFYNCSGLADVYISNPSAWCNVAFGGGSSNPLIYADSLHVLDNNGNNVNSITLDTTVTVIPDYAFKNCISLTSITIPDSITSIGEDAFSHCTSLTEITISDSVASIGDSAFYSCDSLTSVTIPDSVASIGDYAFYSCDSLTSVTIPDSVTSIGDCAFKWCYSLTSVTIGNRVTSIGESAFSHCTSLTEITIPDSVTSIGEDAFYYCTSLTSVTIPDGVTGIGDYAFQWCDSLTSVTIGNRVTSIGNSAFSHCTSLTEITIPDSVTSIGEDAFYYCTSLTSVTIGNGVTSIGNYAFYGVFDYNNRGIIYYSRSQAKWNEIEIGNYNNLNYATIHYNHTHDYSLIPAVTVPATCTEVGYTEYTCAYGEKHRAEYVPALGHIMGINPVVFAPTCDSQGYTAIHCTRCSEISKTDYVDPLGHSMVYEEEKAATCTEDGHTAGTLCSRCGFLGTAAKLEKGHSYDANNKCACGDQKLGVLTQPKTAKVAAGKTAKFTVKASGEGLKYQWQSSSNGKSWKNCTSSTAKKATFSFTSKTSHSSNYYRCKITDSAGNVVYTDAVRLYVLSVTSQPKTKKVEAGEKVKFAVTATGAGKTYQWQVSTNGKTWKNCSSSSATKATFSFTSKTSHQGNYYRCRIKDSGGNTVYTNAVRLYVLGITEQPVSKTVTKGKTAKFTVEATGASKVYQWQVSTDGGKTWKNCSSSSATKATFTFTGKTTHNGNYYRCRIKDSGGNTIYTAKVKLTVKK